MEMDDFVNVTALDDTLSQHHFQNGSCDHLLPTSSQYQKRLVPIFYTFIFLLGFLGNALVICVFCQSSSRWTVANTYLVNLAASDLLFLCSLPFWAVYYSMGYSWVFGRVACKLCGALLMINIYASVFFITCMSVDRYRAIVYPLSTRSVCHARWISISIWLVAVLSSVPTLVFRDTHILSNLNVTACVMIYPNALWHPMLTLAKNILGFLLPFAVMATCYSRIGRHLLATPDLLEQEPSRIDRVLRMVIAVVLAFFLCWCAFHVLAFLEVLRDLGVTLSCRTNQAVEALLPISLCLGFSNSAINPFLYCFVGNHFREQLCRLYEEKAPRLAQRRDSISTRLSSFSRKLSDVKDSGAIESLPQNGGP
ncbi:type-2 angiotensin II receptor [Pygocentrus nattereri]|uniref:G-protein coupled receptors family 1 profile domain-containing protein n=1 Tax=Pygocentrus nattereri TaxID=42514 RepID=A0A3B4BPX6_PYGNA|nr:type-2 angiotensin II receptor [Pygocentrus nattereri]XP_017540187.1 type-2 angiotensin II receptor [Pygocentrus nattereri]